jgi:HEAT repeat protein
VLKSIVKKFRLLLGKLRERAPVRLDDQEFEHLLLYHGLVGTSPENERSFKDVRVDISDAIRSGSAVQLGIALKLEPLQWQDKLETIFKEIAGAQHDNIVRALLPDTEGEPWPNMGDPLGHDNWRVRANAAFVLASLNIKEGQARIIKAMHDTASGASPAFCHIAYALSKFRTEETKVALISHLEDPEPWFRIDAAGALVEFPAEEVRETIVQALLTINPLSDYLAVTVAKRYSVLELLASDNSQLRNGGCQLLNGLAEAATQTFNVDILQNVDIAQCTNKLLELVKRHRSVHALLALWNILILLQEKAESLELGESSQALAKLEADIENELHSKSSISQVEITLSTYAKKRTVTTNVDLLDAIKLAGALKLTTTTNNLLELLKIPSPLQEQIVAALGLAGDARSVSSLLELANSLYKPEERTTPSLSGKTVEESDSVKAKLYWRILQALGNLPSKLTVQFLFNAAADFAPDKRQQVLESLCNLVSSLAPEERAQLVQLVCESLDDPAAPVKVSALKGVAALGAVSYLDRALKLSESLEPSISRQALQTLAQLSYTGDASVLAAIRNKIAQETDPVRKKRLENVLKP